MEKAKIIEKIQKLKAMTTSPNENEAALALELMQKFIDKHNISEEMLRQLQDRDDIIEEAEWEKPRQTALKNWEIRLASAIAKLFDCKIIVSGKSNVYYNGYRHKRNRILFLGTDDDVKIAIEMYDWINATIWRIAKEKSAEEREELNDRIQEWADEHMDGIWTKDDVPDFLRHDGNRFIQSFLVGCTSRIDARVDDILAARKEKYADNEMALTIINTKLQKIEDKMEEMDLQNMATNLRYSDLNGLQKGQQTGDAINLDKQIKENGRNDIGQRLLK